MSCILQLKHVLQCIVYMSLIADLCLQSDDIVMETFYHKSGQIYTCVYQGGQRFYMDSWETQVTMTSTACVSLLSSGQLGTCSVLQGKCQVTDGRSLDIS